MSERTIPKGKVWKYVFEASHAPHYVIQHDNGTFSGIYAPVEKVPGNNAQPFGLTEEKVLEVKSRDHVDVIELPVEQTPWKEGAYL